MSSAPSQQPIDDNFRQMLISGLPLLLSTTAPSDHRVVEAEWIKEAIDAHQPVYIRNAIIRGNLRVRYKNIEKEFVLRRCRFEGHADFSHCEFNQSVSFACTHFQRGISFDSSDFKSTLILDRLEISLRALSLIDTKIAGVFSMERAKVTVRCDFDRAKFSKDVFFRGSIFRKAASFNGATFGEQLSFEGAVFESDFSLNGAIVKDVLIFQANAELGYSPAQFHGPADFIALSVGDDIYSDGVLFRRPLKFHRGCVGGSAHFAGSVFESTAEFSRLKISARAIFDSCTFKDTANFGRLTVSGVARFQGSQFSQDAIFDSSSFGSSVYFRPDGLQQSSFAGRARFSAIDVHGQLEFQNAEFGRDSQLELKRAKIGGDLVLRGVSLGGGAILDRLQVAGVVDSVGANVSGDFLWRHSRIGGPAVISSVEHPTTFKGECDFSFSEYASSLGLEVAKFESRVAFENASISGFADFSDTTWGSGSTVTFAGCAFEHGVAFDGALFGSDVDFRAARISLKARFNGTLFSGGTDFSGASFSCLAEFSSRSPRAAAVFEGTASFQHARFEGDAHFDDTVFKDSVSLRDTTFRIVYFSSSGLAGSVPQFASTIDLIGCEYERMEVDWKAMSVMPDERSRLAPFDRAPYLKLEKQSRDLGDDKSADAIFLERRRVERKLKFAQGRYVAWILDGLYCVTVRYGVHPSIVLLWSALLVILASAFFSVPGAICRKGDSGSPCSVAVPSYRLSAAIAIRYYLPVDTPLASDYVAASDRPVKLQFGSHAIASPVAPSTLASMLRLAGWFFVPVGIASLTGLLRHVSR